MIYINNQIKCIYIKLNKNYFYNKDTTQPIGIA